MDNIASIKRALAAKASEFDINKEIATERIKEGFETARKRLDRAEKELLRKLDLFFATNIYSDFISELESGSSNSLEKAASVAAIPVPTDFGPDEEAFGKLYKEIGRLANKTFSLPALLPPPSPKDITVKGIGENGFYNGVSLSWPAVTPDSSSGVESVKYKVQMVNERKNMWEFNTAETSYAFQNLKPGMKYTFNVRCIWDDIAGPWSDAVEFTPTPIPVPTNVKCAEVKECEATIVWDSVPMSVVWEVEIRRGDSFSDFKRVYAGEIPSCTLERLECDVKYVARVRARIDDDNRGEWCDELEFRTKKWSFSWKQCPPGASYIVKGESDNIVERVGNSQNREDHLVIVGNNCIPIGTTVSWRIKVDRLSSHIGVKYVDNDQKHSSDYDPIYIWPEKYSIHYKQGRRFNIFSDMVLSFKKLEEKKIIERFFPSNFWEVGVVVDTRKGEVTFITNDVVFAVIPQIPLDRPLVPFVTLPYTGSTAKIVIE